MARKPSTKSRQSNASNFRFEYVHWSDAQLTALRKHLSSSVVSVDDTMLNIVESGWKISVSQHEQSGRYIVSLTDKWQRPGLAGITFGIEHGDFVAAIRGACFYADTILDNGIQSKDTEGMVDLW